MVNKVSKRVVLISTLVGKRHKASKMANFPVLLTDGGHFLSLASPHNFLLIFHGSFTSSAEKNTRDALEQ